MPVLTPARPFFRARLNEATRRGGFIKRLGNGRVRIKIIEPGQGSSGFYTEEVLDRAANAGMFDNVPIMRNHPETGQRTEKPDIDLTVGYIEPGAKYMKNGPKGPGVYGVAAILEPSRRMVYAMVDTPFGLSIHADGDLERHQDPTSRVLDITKVHSVDMVVKPGAGGAFIEVLESEDLTPITEEDRMPNRLFEDSQGNQFIHIGNIFEDEDAFDEDGLEEARFGRAADAARRGASAVGRGMRRAGAAAKERGGRAARTARDRGRAFASSPRGRMALAAGGGAAAGAAAMRGRRREEMEEDFDEEEDIFEDSEGNRFQYIGNIHEDEDLEEYQRPGPGPQTTRMQRAGIRAGATGRSMGRRARAGATRFIRRHPLAAAGGAALAGAAAMRGGRRKEEEIDEEEENIFEDADGNRFVLVGNIHEDDADYNGVIDETIEDLYEQLNEIRNGPERDRRLRDIANISTVGSFGSRRLTEEIALRYADNPREAQKIGRAVGAAIMEDRASRNSSWATQEMPRWDDQPARRRSSSAGFWASNGGNALAEADRESFNTDIIDQLFR